MQKTSLLLASAESDLLCLHCIEVLFAKTLGLTKTVLPHVPYSQVSVYKQ
jgi:hypothetical protein